VPVVLKNSSTIKGNCTECFHRDHHVVGGFIASSLATNYVVLWESWCTYRCEWQYTAMFFALGVATVLYARSTINDKKQV